MQAAVITYKAARQVESERERERKREKEERGLLYSKTTHLHMYMQRVLGEGEEREEDHVLATRNTFHM